MILHWYLDGEEICQNSTAYFKKVKVPLTKTPNTQHEIWYQSGLKFKVKLVFIKIVRKNNIGLKTEHVHYSNSWSKGQNTTMAYKWNIIQTFYSYKILVSHWFEKHKWQKSLKNVIVLHKIMFWCKNKEIVEICKLLT